MLWSFNVSSGEFASHAEPGLCLRLVAESERFGIGSCGAVAEKVSARASRFEWASGVYCTSILSTLGFRMRRRRHELMTITAMFITTRMCM